ELPILMVAATQATGQTIIKNAAELRVKESDRISAMVSNLSRMGANIRCLGNDIIIDGPSSLTGSRQIESFDDHRIAMSLIIAALAAKGNTTINNIDCIKISFPDFLETLAQLT
ncbi:MAG: 3-phosphoshikimate 1-carboxyvinyltransferase, partial [Candidatus Omnitrophota bacterium]